MKNNRRIQIDDAFIEKHNLSTTPPPENSIFWKMWNACTSIANETLGTRFIQGIGTGTLDPVTYGGFNVIDAYYCFHGAQTYLAAQSRATDPTLQAFLLKKYESYQNYNKTFPDIWHVRDAEGVVPDQVCKDYAAFEANVASHQDPIYTLIVMLPCDYLWSWLGAQLSPPKEGNLYTPWINGNNDPDGAYAIGNYLDQYQEKHPIDENTAIQLYTQAMTFEQQNFLSATN